MADDRQITQYHEPNRDWIWETLWLRQLLSLINLSFQIETFITYLQYLYNSNRKLMKPGAFKILFGTSVQYSTLSVEIRNNPVTFHSLLLSDFPALAPTHLPLKSQNF